MSNIVLLGNHRLARQFPMWGKGGSVRYWAERGLVHWEDERKTNKKGQLMYGSMSWHSAARRVKALSEMVLRSSEKDKGYYRDEVQRLQQFIIEMTEVIRQAKEQGGPHDATARRDHLRRRAKTVLMPPRIDTNLW